MKLKEYSGKEIFNNYSIKIPNGFVISNIKDIDENINNIKANDLVVKAQLLSGGRGKSGVIKFCNKKNINETVRGLLNKKVSNETIKEVLIEEELKIDKKFYLSLTINREDKDILLIFSQDGGIDIEELSESSPEKIIKIPIIDNHLNIINKKDSIKNDQ